MDIIATFKKGTHLAELHKSLPENKSNKNAECQLHWPHERNQFEEKCNASKGFTRGQWCWQPTNFDAPMWYHGQSHGEKNTTGRIYDWCDSIGVLRFNASVCPSLHLLTLVVLVNFGYPKTSTAGLASQNVLLIFRHQISAAVRRPLLGSFFSASSRFSTLLLKRGFGWKWMSNLKFAGKTYN